MFTRFFRSLRGKGPGTAKFSKSAFICDIRKRTGIKIISTISGFSVVSGVLAYQYGRVSILSNPPDDLFPLKSVTKLSGLQPPKYASEKDFSAAITELTDILGEKNVLNSAVEIEYHTINEFTTHPPLDHESPKYVVYAHSTEDVSNIMKIAYKYSVPVVPYAGGTSLEGHFHSTRLGIVLDVSKMNKILEVHHDDLDAVVQAGVNWQNLNKELEPFNLMLGADCGPDGLISGMINTNASGINASRYGAMISNVISVTAVLADGTVVKTRQRPRKTSSGYNLTGLFVGSEGTLGVITEATVKLHVKPKYETVVVGQFPSILDITNTVAQLFRQGVNPNAMELLDKDMIHCINYSEYFTREWLECPTIFFKIGGLNQTVVEENLKELKKVAQVNNCQRLIFAENKDEEEELFSARKNAFYAILNYGRNEIDENVRLWVTDIAVPISKMSYVLGKVQEYISESGMQSIILGHVGDGNFHADIFYTEDQKQKCRDTVEKMIMLSLENEGTCTGEHGIGNAKRAYLVKELGEETVSAMRKIKMSLDPKRILNPDKIFKIDPKDMDEM